MIEAYLLLAERIQQELGEVQRAMVRAERAIQLARSSVPDQDLYLDAAALNLHDFYTGLERTFQHVAATIDDDLPAGRDWHSQLLHQMNHDVPGLRPAVLSEDTVSQLDEFRRFRHIVRNIYAFQFDPDRLERLVVQMSEAFDRVQAELLALAQFLRQVGTE